MIEIELDRVVRRYPGAAAPALDHLSLKVNAGDTLALLGPSGCGKSTALRLVAGFDPPDGGRVLLGGENVAGEGKLVPPEKRPLAMVFQTWALWPHRNVLENVAYPLRLRKDPQAVTKAREALARVHLSGFEERRPSQLSGGQQQRVALARALVSRPKALLLDEPTSSLDARLREEVRAELARLTHETGATTILVTHDRADALAIADQIAVLRAGKLEQLGRPRDLFERPGSRFVAELVAGARVLQAVALGPDRVAIDGGDTLEAEVVGAKADEAVDLCVRPDGVIVTASGAGAKARVRACAFQGDRVLLELSIGGGLLHATVDPQSAPEVDAEVRVTLSRARAFPRESGAAASSSAEGR